MAEKSRRPASNNKQNRWKQSDDGIRQHRISMQSQSALVKIYGHCNVAAGQLQVAQLRSWSEVGNGSCKLAYSKYKMAETGKSAIQRDLREKAGDSRRHSWSGKSEKKSFHTEQNGQDNAMDRKDSGEVVLAAPSCTPLQCQYNLAMVQLLAKCLPNRVCTHTAHRTLFLVDQRGKGGHFEGGVACVARLLHTYIVVACSMCHVHASPSIQLAWVAPPQQMRGNQSCLGHKLLKTKRWALKADIWKPLRFIDHRSRSIWRLMDSNANKIKALRIGCCSGGLLYSIV